LFRLALALWAWLLVAVRAIAVAALPKMISSIKACFGAESDRRQFDNMVAR